MRASFILPLLTLLTPIFAAPSTTATTSASTSVTSLPSIPPACLLHAVNTQDEPADLKAVCGNGVSEIQSYLAENCGQHADVAQAVFIDRCERAGSSVAAYTATSSSDSSSQTGTITAGANGSTTSSGARGGAAVSTAGANNEHQRVARGPMAAAAIALVGAVAAL